jgi:Transcription termination factor nusG.
MNEKNENINTPWYALRFFSNKNHKIERFFENEKLTFFIPMVYKYKTDKDDSGSRQRIVVSPACPHLLFLKKDRTEEQIVKILSSYNEPLMLYKYPGSKDICEISSVEMLEFRMMCDIGMNYNNNGIFDIIPPCDDIEGKEVIITKGAVQGCQR